MSFTIVGNVLTINKFSCEWQLCKIWRKKQNYYWCCSQPMKQLTPYWAPNIMRSRFVTYSIKNRDITCSCSTDTESENLFSTLNINISVTRNWETKMKYTFDHGSDFTITTAIFDDLLTSRDFELFVGRLSR